MKNNRVPFLAASLVALAPLAVLLTGCGGGSNSSTPIPSSTPTPTPTPGPFMDAPINFGNGQSGTLSLRIENTHVAGTVQVTAPIAPVGGASALTAQSLPEIKSGTYKVAGNFIPARNFLVTGKFPSPVGAFTIQGTFPSTAQAGTYTMVIGKTTQDDGVTINGIYPKIDPSATPTPTATTIG